jgi:cation diffusion facilitator family transporter
VGLLGIGVAVMALSALVNQIISARLFKVGKETESVALMADGWHLRTDVYTSLGVMVALGVIWAGGRFLPGVNLLWVDPLVAMVVALLILRAAWRLTRESIRDLLDASLPEEEQRWIHDYFIALRPAVLSFHRLRTRKSGNTRFIDLHVVVEPSMTVEESHDLSHRIEDEIRAHFADSNTLVHIEPCDESCSNECEENCYKKQ